MNRLLGLELLRGVAATLVLLEHVRYSVQLTCGRDALSPWPFQTFVGSWGVDIFFVLSGYLIALTLSKPDATARGFLLARLARVYPLYAVVSAVCLAFPLIRCFEFSGRMVLTTATLLPLSGDAMDPMTAHPYGWTLCYEMLFYLAAAAATVVVGGRRATPALAAAFAAAAVAFAAVGPTGGWLFPNFALSPIVVEFALGIAAYHATARVGGRWAWAAVAASVPWFAHSFRYADDFGFQGLLIADPWVAWQRVACWGVPAALLVLGTARLDRDATFAPVARLATAAGAVSYSLYLVQPIAFALTKELAALLGLAYPGGVAALTLAVTFGLAALASRLIDHPLHRRAKAAAKGLLTAKGSTPAFAPPARPAPQVAAS